MSAASGLGGSERSRLCFDREWGWPLVRQRNLRRVRVFQKISPPPERCCSLTGFGRAVYVRVEDAWSLIEKSGIRAVHSAAFARPDEADLVDELRKQGHALLSLVAEIDGDIVGHIVFSRMWVEAPGGRVSAVALAPVAVLPDHQRTGVGSLLIRHGLELLGSFGEKIVIVLGDPSYYHRFGFSSEKAKVFTSPFPPEAFMVTELSPGALDGVRGAAVYPPPFGL